MPRGVNELRDEALRIAVEHGFTDATVGEDLMLMVTELAEAMEDHRAHEPADLMWYEYKDNDGTTVRTSAPSGLFGHPYPITRLHKPCGIPSEMADVVIRVLHFCGKHKIDLEKAVTEKMAYNDSRPYKHGKVI